MIIPILMYHSINLQTSNHLTVSQKQFRQQIKHLSSNYNILSLDDIIHCKDFEKLTPESIVISLDDSLKNNIDYALPVLDEFKVKAVFFVVAGHIIGKNRGDRKVIKDLERMNEDDLDLLLSSGHTIGNHSLTHSYLPDLSNEMLEKEFVTSNLIFEENIGFKPQVFAYPYGDTDQRCLDLCREHFKYGFSTVKEGYFDWNIDQSKIRRIYVLPQDDAESLNYKISCYKEEKQHK
jgi:peptidoglycan/xylan/chitin deacetylase (PgdA/CDA1 family)